MSPRVTKTEHEPPRKLLSNGEETGRRPINKSFRGGSGNHGGLLQSAEYAAPNWDSGVRVGARVRVRVKGSRVGLGLGLPLFPSQGLTKVLEQ